MNADPLIVGGREIAAETIAAEAQHHPAASAEEAWTAAAEALAVRQLLLDEALRLELDPGDVRDEQGQQLTREDALIDALLAHAIHTPEADPETCRRFYDSHPESFVTRPLIEAAHILIEADPSDEFAMGLATADARTLIRQLQSNPDGFAELARQHSACPSAKRGGELGQVQPGQMVEPFEQALFALPANTLCPNPVRTRFGVHVIHSRSRADGSRLPFETVQPAIAEYLEEASYRHAVAQYITVLVEQTS